MEKVEPRSGDTSSIRREEPRRTFILIRLIIVFALLISTVFIFFGASSSELIAVLKYLYYGVALYLVVILGRLFVTGEKAMAVASFLQIAADAGFVSLLVYATGMYDSFFTFLYVIVMILGSLELYMTGGIVAGVVASLFYSTLIYLQYRGALSLPFSGYTRTISFQDLLIHIMAHDFGFMLSGILAGILGNELKKSRIQVERRETDIKLLEDFNRNIIENIESGILTVDWGGVVSFVNRTALNILGLSLSDVLRKPAVDVIPGFFTEEEQGESRHKRMEHMFKRRDGKLIFLGFSMSTLRDGEGREQGNILIFQDLTNVKEMEERIKLADRMGMLGELAAGLAHEIRNPLASIAGSAQILLDSKGKEDEELTLLEIIGKESRRLNNLIKDFLTFARPDVRGYSDVDLEGLCREVINALGVSEGNEKDVSVDLDVRKNSKVVGDAEKLKQVMWNLLLNAYQAVDDGGRVDVVIDIGENGGNGLSSITVSDDGNGVSDESRKKIFDPFFTTKEGGTGMGLAVTSRIVQIHEGYMEVKSEPGKGSSFKVILPTGPEGVK